MQEATGLISDPQTLVNISGFLMTLPKESFEGGYFDSLIQEITRLLPRVCDGKSVIIFIDPVLSNKNIGMFLQSPSPVMLCLLVNN